MASTVPGSSSPFRRSSRSKRSSPYFSMQSEVGEGTASATNTISKGSSSATAKSKADDQTKKRRLAPKKQTKRKANSSSQKTKRKKSTATPVERTRSFGPAWWGNALTTDTDAGGGLAPTPANTPRAASLPPVHTLILGTHPSVASLEKHEMYGHPQNAFWYIAGDALGFRRSAAVSLTTGKPYVTFHEHLRHSDDDIIDYPQQLERMCEKGFAMWDIVAECEREGSLDTAIVGEVANPIREFCEGTLPSIGSEHLGIQRIVLSNGTTGAKFFVKHFTDWFLDGTLYAAGDDLSQRVFKAVTNKAKKANTGRREDEARKGRVEVVCLPGVSPAAASIKYVDKRHAWEKECYGPGLADYDVWCTSRASPSGRAESSNPRKSFTPSPTEPPVTPVKRKTSPPAQAASKRKSVPPSPTKKPSVHLFSSDLAELAPGNHWVDLEVPANELRPSATLTNGQCFNWLVVDVAPAVVGTSGSPQKEQQSAWGTHDAKEWVGPLQNRVISVRETPTTTMFRVLHGPTSGVKEYLQRYFRLETPLAPLYQEWSQADARLAKIATAIPGVRMLRQEPLECMFSFICSSNNNIPRIHKMLAAFRETYGTFMLALPMRREDEGRGTLPIFSFPDLDALAAATEDHLRGMGLGYRAKFIIETRNLLVECGGEEFLLDLRTERDADTVQAELIKFSGVGRKVADCIALFSLDQDDAIPVDVHVQHIASRDYDPTVLGEAKSITPTVYKRVGALFRERFRNYSGWAHSLLFVAELPSFRGILPAEVVREMDEWKDLEKRKKQEKREETKKERAK